MKKDKERIRVMHVAECAGGVDRYLKSLLRYTDKKQVENIMVLSELYKDKDYESLADRVEIVKIPHGIGPQELGAIFSIRRLVKQYQPDIVYAHSSIAGAITRLGNIGLNNICIYNPHGWAFNMQGKKKRIFSLAEKILAFFCDAIICISEAEKQSALRKRICSNDKLIVIENGIDVDYIFKNSISKLDIGIKNDNVVVGMVGRVSKQKAVDIFVRMAAEINRKVENVSYVVVGDVLESSSAEKEAVYELARELNVDLKITGWVSEPLEYIRLFDVACLLSRWEGFGLAVPEYMLCEKPVVATRVDAIPYIIQDGVNGLLVEVDDYCAAADLVLDIIDNKKLAEKLVENGTKTVLEKYNIQRVADQSYSFMRMLVRNGKNERCSNTNKVL